MTLPQNFSRRSLTIETTLPKILRLNALKRESKQTRRITQPVKRGIESPRERSRTVQRPNIETGNAQGRPAALTATTDRQAITKNDLTPIRLARTADLSVVRTGERPRTQVLANISRLTGITTARRKYVQAVWLASTCQETISHLGDCRQDPRNPWSPTTTNYLRAEGTHTRDLQNAFPESTCDHRSIAQRNAGAW